MMIHTGTSILDLWKKGYDTQNNATGIGVDGGTYRNVIESGKSNINMNLRGTGRLWEWKVNGNGLWLCPILCFGISSFETLA
jgi:hypothetical protein